MGAQAISLPRRGEGGAPLRRVNLRADAMLPVADDPLVPADTGQMAPAVWLVAAHGGAGVTSLSHVWEPMGDAGQQWPAADEHPWCVVVCRSTKTGLEKAHQAVLQAWADRTGGCEVLGVVVVADAPGKLPKSLARKIAVIEEIVEIWHVPYLAELRLNEAEDLASWQPGAAAPERRRMTTKRAVPATEEVPAVLAAVAEDVFSSAMAAHKAQSPTNKEK